MGRQDFWGKENARGEKGRVGETPWDREQARWEVCTRGR